MALQTLKQAFTTDVSPILAMARYRAGGAIAKRKDILADNARRAVARAASDDDCPVCDVWRDGEKVGSIS